MGWKTGAAIAVACSCAGAPAAGAATIDGAKYEKSIKAPLTKRTGVKATSASCPDEVQKRKGYAFTCRVTFRSGDKVAVRVTLADSAGRYTLAIRQLLLRRIESVLSKAAGGKDVTCPQGPRKVRKGDRFTCKIAGGGSFTVTQLGAARVTYRRT